MEIVNAKRRSFSYGLRLHDAIIGPVGHPREEAIELRGFLIEAPPARRGGRARVAVPIQVARRGLYSVERAQILSRFPFGLVERVRNQQRVQRLLVLPRLLPTLAILPLVPKSLGEVETDQKGIGHGLYGVRDYQRGDPARIIHWKHSARGQGYKVKEFEHEAARGFRLMLDLHFPPGAGRTQEADFEKAVSVTASLARMLIRRGVNVGLWTSAGNVPVHGGADHLMRILRALAQVQPLPPAAPAVAPAALAEHVDEIWIEYLPHGVHSKDAASSGAGRGAQRTIVDARRVQAVSDPAAPLAAR